MRKCIICFLVITGVRRCGKSTLLQMYADELLQKGVEQAQIQFLNFEDLDTLAIGDIFQIHTHIKTRLVEDKMNYVFLDEVQNINEFQRLVDSLYIKKKIAMYILPDLMPICFRVTWRLC